VTHRHNLGGTEIVFQALKSGGVDVYAEYTGTSQEVILKERRRLSLPEMRVALAREGLAISDPIGFNDGYALAVTREVQQRYGLRTISDLAGLPDLRLGLTHEFMGRADGWPGLARHYGLAMKNVRGIQHELAYGALAQGAIDATDIYTTDAQIERMQLVVLDDDRDFFPRYDAVWLYRLDLEHEPRARAAMRRLVGAIDEARMIRANARVVLAGETFQQSAAALVAEIATARDSGRAASPGQAPGRSVLAAVASNTAQHLQLVAISLLLAIVIGVPLGVLASEAPGLAAVILTVSGLLQTVPSLALLAVLIPLLGIGAAPALVALFLYSLLPIVRNTYVGLTTLPAPLAESAAVIGLTPTAQLLRVRVPMASPAIMAGIKTSAVINVGTATLAALIGAGGLGEPILSGIQLRRNDLILEGAIPAALLALLVERVFSVVDRIVIPKGLRLPRARG
jgi:osmoprotectant transport system permease protein